MKATMTARVVYALADGTIEEDHYRTIEAARANLHHYPVYKGKGTSPIRPVAEAMEPRTANIQVTA
jgi:hypothetical protein